MVTRIAITLFILVGIAYAVCFRVYEYQAAILFQIGKIQRSDFEPGLHFKIPGIQNVMTFDKRLQTLDAEPQRFLTGEKKDVIVDSFARWRIQSVEQFYKSTDGDFRRAGLLVYQKINDSLDVKAIVGKATFPSILEKANASETDMIIAVTRNDEINMLICQIAFSIFNIPKKNSKN